MTKYRSKANANIALIKYWGKKDEELFLPYTSSLSLTLDALYTETEVSFIDEENDVFYLDAQLQGEKETLKIKKFIDIFRKKSAIDRRVLVNSYNHVPTAAGLASSASGYAALALALNKLFNLNLDRKELSIITRKGSGSATRSIYGGIVEWHKGDSDENSYAEKVDDGDFDLAMIIIVVNSNKKEISSREAMKITVNTSPLYQAYVENSALDLVEIKKAIKDRDIKRIGEISEHNAMKMHSTILSSNPPMLYFEGDSLIAINKVKELREKGFDAYYTMDAGPNVKIVTKKSQAEEIKKELLDIFSEEKIIISDISSEDGTVEEIE